MLVKLFETAVGLLPVIVLRIIIVCKKNYYMYRIEVNVVCFFHIPDVVVYSSIQIKGGKLRASIINISEYG